MSVLLCCKPGGSLEALIYKDSRVLICGDFCSLWGFLVVVLVVVIFEIKV